MLHQKIVIDKKEFISKRSFGADLLFKTITGRDAPTFADTMPDAVILLFCNLKAANQGKFDYSTGSFISYLKDHPETFDDPENCAYEVCRKAYISDN